MNEVLRFLVANVFQRVSTDLGEVRFAWHLDDRLPPVHVNEFVVWEVFEPIIQNSIITPEWTGWWCRSGRSIDPGARESRVVIADNGRGIAPGAAGAERRRGQEVSWSMSPPARAEATIRDTGLHRPRDRDAAAAAGGLTQEPRPAAGPCSRSPSRTTGEAAVLGDRDRSMSC